MHTYMCMYVLMYLHTHVHTTVTGFVEESLALPVSILRTIIVWKWKFKVILSAVLCNQLHMFCEYSLICMIRIKFTFNKK